jgi:hypothetical protein
VQASDEDVMIYYLILKNLRDNIMNLYWESMLLPSWIYMNKRAKSFSSGSNK